MFARLTESRPNRVDVGGAISAFHSREQRLGERQGDPTATMASDLTPSSTTPSLPAAHNPNIVT